MIINGVRCTTIEEVEAQITNLSEDQKQAIRNDFLGIPNLPPANPVPKSVTTRQIMEALIRTSYATGNTSLHPNSLTAFLNSMPAGVEKDIALANWEKSNEFFRDNPLIATMAPMLGLTDEDVDNLFRLAATL